VGWVYAVLNVYGRAWHAMHRSICAAGKGCLQRALARRDTAFRRWAGCTRFLRRMAECAQ
jgi:hypothetical protein